MWALTRSFFRATFGHSHDVPWLAHPVRITITNVMYGFFWSHPLQIANGQANSRSPPTLICESGCQHRDFINETSNHREFTSKGFEPLMSMSRQIGDWELPRVQAKGLCCQCLDRAREFTSEGLSLCWRCLNGSAMGNNQEFAGEGSSLRR